jgi:predicted enzyme related to lactoylglutathione lyase
MEHPATTEPKGSTNVNLGFVILYVSDMAASKAFYTDVVGLTVVEEVSSPNFVTLRGEGGSLLSLQNKATAQFPPKDESSNGGVELSFAAEDVDDAWRRWQARGVTLVTEPLDLPFGRYFMARDPEGYYLSVYRLAPPATAGQGN